MKVLFRTRQNRNISFREKKKTVEEIEADIAALNAQLGMMIISF